MLTGHLPKKRKATREDAKGFIAQAFTDRISWTAAHVLLERVTKDPAYDQLDAATRGAVERFLVGHKKPVTLQP